MANKMNRELQLKLYQDFIVNCTTVSKSVKNYSDFKRINECLALLFPAKKDVSILDFDNPIEFEDVISKLTIQKQFVDYEQKGGNQYSNTLKHYLRFLYAKMMFSKTCNLASNNNDKKHPLQQIFYGAPGTGKSNTIKSKVEEKGRIHFRTTFHPDSDYSTFVGCYKPTMIQAPVRDGSGHEVSSATIEEKAAFLTALYLKPSPKPIARLGTDTMALKIRNLFFLSSRKSTAAIAHKSLATFSNC